MSKYTLRKILTSQVEVKNRGNVLGEKKKRIIGIYKMMAGREDIEIEHPVN